jgi:hypothetical protein
MEDVTELNVPEGDNPRIALRWVGRGAGAGRVILDVTYGGIFCRSEMTK